MLLRAVTLLASTALAARATLRSLRHFDVKDKVVVITGGSRGLGLALARTLSQRGAKLALCARNLDELKRVQDELQAGVFVAACDVTSEDQMKLFVANAERALGPIDVLIANAATIQVGPLGAQTKGDFERAMNEIFWGAYHATMAVLPSMQQRRAGRIVHIASFGGKVAVPHLAPYCSAKFALEGFSTGLRAELAKDGIYVTTVSPGLMRTGSHLHAKFKGDAPKEFSWFSLGMAVRVGSMDPDVAAPRIVKALQDGDAELLLGLPAKIASAAHGLFPNAVGEVMALVDRFLPADSGRTGAQRGADVKDEAPGAAVIRTLDPAAAKFNQN